MKKKVLVVLLAAAVMLFGAACGKTTNSSSSGASSSASSDQSSVQDSESGDSDSAAEENSDEEESGEDAGEAGADADDPANSSGVMEDNRDESSAEVKAEYVGTWKLKGVLQRDGSIDNADNISGKYVIKSDGTYQTTMTNPDGGKSSSSGKWELTAKKNLSADTTLGLSDEGDYLLKYSGERDGKGFRLYYAYEKVK